MSKTEISEEVSKGLSGLMRQKVSEKELQLLLKVLSIFIEEDKDEEDGNFEEYLTTMLFEVRSNFDYNVTSILKMLKDKTE